MADINIDLQVAERYAVQESTFDQVIQRRNTGCLKYDFAEERGMPKGVLPLWVADMDFAAPKEVLDAIEARVRHGIFGYAESGEAYFDAVAGWMKGRHGWEVERDWLVKTRGALHWPWL